MPQGEPTRHEARAMDGSTGHGPIITTVDEAAAALGEPLGKRLNVLMLADDAHPADVVIDHIDAIRHHSRHRVTVVNPIRNRCGWVMSALKFDVLVIHYSICILVEHFLPKAVADAVKRFSGPKIQIIQDEYRWIDRMSQRMFDLGVGAVFSSLAPENISRVYHHEHLAGVQFFSGMPGYVPERLHRVATKALSERPFDLVYRGRPLPIWLGRFGQDKVAIGLQAIEMARKYDLAIDCKVREEERVYGTAWGDLLIAGRAALATEGGAAVFDFDESVEKGVKSYREMHPDADNEEIWEKVVRPYDGNVVHKTITPRVLEAIMHRTALVMYPGDYRGVLEPWQHYIPLERDGSNEEEVARLLKDGDRLEELVERAYRRVADNPRLQFKNYVSAIDFCIEEVAGRKGSVKDSDGIVGAWTVGPRTVLGCVVSFVERQSSDAGRIVRFVARSRYMAYQVTKSILCRLLNKSMGT